MLDRINFSSILNFLVLAFRFLRWSEHFYSILPDPAILFITLFFLYSIVLLSFLNKEMTSSSTVPPKLGSFYRTGQNTAAVIFVPFLKMK